LKKWLYLSVMSFFLSSVTIWFLPYDSIRIALGAVFWLGLIAGLLFLRPISNARKSDKMHMMCVEKGAPHFFRFFSNKPAIAADVALIISFVIAVVAFFAPTVPQGLALSGVFGVVFFLEMHGVFNGRNYAYISSWGYH
jgi:hypothetical protein